MNYRQAISEKTYA